MSRHNQSIVCSYIHGEDLMVFMQLSAPTKELVDLMTTLFMLNECSTKPEYLQGELWIEREAAYDGLKGISLYFAPGFQSRAMSLIKSFAASKLQSTCRPKERVQ